MRLQPAHRRFVSWMAMLAVLVAGLAPAVSQAMRGGSARWVEVCTVLGSTWVQVDDAGAAPSGAKASSSHPAFKHCLYASLFAAGLATAPDLPAFRGAPLRFDAPHSAPAPAARRPALLSAQPRGPPLPLV